MDETTTKRTCPYCAEEIAAAALRCPFCRTRLATFDPSAWWRDQPERRVAGVASAIAHATAVPVGGVRLAFGVLTFVHLLGPLLYGLGWLLIPRRAGEPSTVERVLDDAVLTLRRWRGGAPTPPTSVPGGRSAC
jgi:phage shock protein PspC (stress-responsive transcriptional regulator)